MADTETAFGGGGRLINTNDLNRAVDSVNRMLTRMEQAVGKSVTLFDRVSSVGHNFSRSYGSGKAGFGAGHTPGVPNGGGATFGGSGGGGGGSRGNGGASQYDGAGKRRAPGPAQTGTFSQILQTGNGGHRAHSYTAAFAVGAGINLASQLDS